MGQEARYVVDPRLARSLSPGTSTENLLRLVNRTADDDDSDDDIIGFWSRDSGDEAVFSDSESDGDGDSLPVLDEEDEDDDSDDEILLIGHR